MDYTNILKKAWKNVISYRALWIFGVIIAITTASSMNMMFSDRAQPSDGEPCVGIMCTGVTVQPMAGESRREAVQRAFDEAGEVMQKNMDEADREMTQFFREELGWNIRSNIVGFMTFMLWTILILGIVGAVLRYVSETALISMVNEREESGEQLKSRDGFRLGFSRTSWRLFLIDVIIFVPVALVFIVLFAVVFAPLLLMALDITEVSIFSGVLTGGLFFLFIFLAIITDQLIKILKHFARRESVVKGESPIDAIRSGFALARSNLKEVGIIWLVLVGVSIGFPVLVGIFAVLLVAADIVVSGIIALLVGLTASLLGAAQPVLVGALVGGPIFILLLVIPLVLLDGMREVFASSTWTLTYRELKALSSMEAEAVPEVEEGDK